MELQDLSQDQKMASEEEKWLVVVLAMMMVTRCAEVAYQNILTNRQIELYIFVALYAVVCSLLIFGLLGLAFGDYMDTMGLYQTNNPVSCTK